MIESAEMNFQLFTSANANFIGSDFDGISSELEFKDCAGMPMIEEGLNQAFTAREVDLITHGNALRVMKDNLGA